MATATVKIQGATYEDVPSVRHSDGNGNFNEFYLTNDANMTADDLVAGKMGYGVNGPVYGDLSVKTVYVGAGTPPSSLGENGDIYLRTN